MARFVISGNKSLDGEIDVMGSKNAALKIFPLIFLTEEVVRITNAPDIEDIQRVLEMLSAMKHKAVKVKERTLELQYKNQNIKHIPDDLFKKLRASIVFVGPILASYGEVTFPHPGGDVIGTGMRPIDIFLEGFRKMGAKVEVKDGKYRLRAKKLCGANIFFPRITVTGTESLMMTACRAEGITILKNCAMEPEIVSLAEFLNSIGAEIKGAGTPIIKIKGVKKLRGGEYGVMPDRIEAGTFAILAAASYGNVFIKNCDPQHLEALLFLFDRVGVKYKLTKDGIHVLPSKKLLSRDVFTHEYPGFATDLQPPYTVLMTQAEGSSLIHETIYDRRLLFADLLTQMGANIIMADPHRVVVTGPTKLYGRKLVSPDIRAGMALLIAGLIAHGVTEIDNIYQIDRGYEKIDERLKKIGADIRRIE